MNYRAEHKACGWSSRRHVGLSDAERAAIEHWKRCPESEQGACRIVCVSAGQSARKGPNRTAVRGSLTAQTSGPGDVSAPRDLADTSTKEGADMPHRSPIDALLRERGRR